MLQQQICSLQQPTGNRNFCLGLRGERYFVICSSACTEVLKHSNLWNDSEGTSKQQIVTPLNGFDILKRGSGSLNFPGTPRLLFPHRDFTESAAELESIWKTEGMGNRGMKRR